MRRWGVNTPNTSLEHYSQILYNMERQFAYHYGLAHFPIAMNIALLYNQLLNATKQTYPEYRHR